MVVPHADVARTPEQALGGRVGAVVAPVRPETGEVDGRPKRPGQLGVSVHARRRAGVVGVDHVPQAHKDVRPPGADRVQDREALDGVATDVLPGHVAAEGEPDRGGRGFGRRSPERTALAGTGTADTDSIGVPLGRGQAVEADLAGPVVHRLYGNWFDPPVRPPGQGHPQDSAALRPRPQHRRPRRNVAHHDPVTHRGGAMTSRPSRRSAGKSESRGHRRRSEDRRHVDRGRSHDHGRLTRWKMISSTGSPFCVVTVSRRMFLSVTS